MSRAKKTKIITIPPLFPRGRRGIFYYREFKNGGERWKSTHTADRAEAEKVRDAILGGGDYGRSLSRDERSVAKLAHKVAAAIVKDITGKSVKRTPIAGGLERWISSSTKFDKLTKATQKYHRTIYGQFSKWCQEKGVESVEDVTLETASRYAKHLSENGISARTYNGHIACLSKVFAVIDRFDGLPYRNPFDEQNVSRESVSGADTVSKGALEPDDLQKVIAQAAKAGPNFRDLIVIGANTGLRLKDAVLLRWVDIDGDFIDLKPHKTMRSGNTARLPISPALRAVLDARMATRGENQFVLPELARHYQANHFFVNQNVQRIFDQALGDSRTRVTSGKRCRKTCVYGYHSFRVTYMSLLAAKNVSARDAMRMMGWKDPAMVQTYERLMEKARQESDDRARKAVDSIKELQLDIPECPRKLVPTEPALRQLVAKYSNETIGQIYDMTGTAIKKWLTKFDIKRAGRVLSGKLDDKTLEKVRRAVTG